MRGVILAGGSGSRLMPATKVTNKHLLLVYDKPMIYYPLKTLINAGIKEILIISGKGHAGHFLELLGSGEEFGVRLQYAIQDKHGGIAHALSLAEKFANNEPIFVILGDNIHEENYKEHIKNFDKGGMVFIKKVSDPERFGVAELKNEQIISIDEKPKKPKSNYAVTGLYLYDSRVFDIIKTLKPSSRGELEITDVNNHFINIGEMKFAEIGEFWSDAGTFESLFNVNKFMFENYQKKQY